MGAERLAVKIEDERFGVCGVLWNPAGVKRGKSLGAGELVVEGEEIAVGTFGGDFDGGLMEHFFGAVNFVAAAFALHSIEERFGTGGEIEAGSLHAVVFDEVREWGEVGWRSEEADYVVGAERATDFAGLIAVREPELAVAEESMDAAFDGDHRDVSGEAFCGLCSSVVVIACLDCIRFAAGECQRNVTFGAFRAERCDACGRVSSGECEWRGGLG
jgi:hypothetical protein